MTDKETKIKYNLEGSRTFIKKCKRVIRQMEKREASNPLYAQIPVNVYFQLGLKTGFIKSVTGDYPRATSLNLRTKLGR